MTLILFFFLILVDISIYKDEDQLKDLEKRKKVEERKKSKQGKQNVKDKPTKSRSTDPLPTNIKSTKSKKLEVPSLLEDIEEKKDDTLDEEDNVLASSKSKTPKPRSAPLNSKNTRTTKSQPIVDSTKSSESSVKPIVDEVKSTRRAPARRASDAVSTKSSLASSVTRVNKEGSSAETKATKEPDVDATKPETINATDNLPAKLANKKGNKVKNNKNEVSTAETKETLKPPASIKPSQRAPKRKVEKEVFEFEDDFEEEVMPMPKKRAALKTYNEEENPAKDSGKEKSNPKTDSKGKEVKNNGKSHNDAGEADSSVAVSSTKTVNAPKSSKRGRGRSRK